MVTTETKIPRSRMRATEGQRSAKKAKQEDLPTMEPQQIPEVQAAAEKYVEVRDIRIATTRDEVERRTELIDLMKKHKLTTYAFDGLSVTLESLDKVKVKVDKDEDDQEVY